jgi:SAM-dependent methyltransferase
VSGNARVAGLLDVTNRFVLDFAFGHGGRVLDYGCGAGALVNAGLANGLDMWGTDVFYGGAVTDRTAAATSGLLGDRVLQMSDDGLLPFADESFDLVTNSMVMEHVEDLDATLREISRVLKVGGTVLSMFPSRDVWREGHIGIPFAHQFPVGSAIRRWYTRGLRTFGLGIFKRDGESKQQWASDKLEWIDTWTHYRTREEIHSTYARYFRSELRERDYIRYRLMDRPGAVRKLLARSTTAPVVSDLEQAVFRKLAFLVIVSTRD